MALILRKWILDTLFFLEQRKEDKFYYFDGVVLEADENGAQNILSRLYDDEMQLYIPYSRMSKTSCLKEVGNLCKIIILTQIRLGLLNQDSSCNGKNRYQRRANYLFDQL